MKDTKITVLRVPTVTSGYADWGGGAGGGAEGSRAEEPEGKSNLKQED